jgi:hypothetical protein
MDLATPHFRDQCLRQLGAVQVWPLGLGPAVWVDLDWRRTMGLGAVSLRTLGLPRRLLGLVAAQSVSKAAQLVASGTRGIRNQYFDW